MDLDRYGGWLGVAILSSLNSTSCTASEWLLLLNASLVCNKAFLICDLVTDVRALLLCITEIWLKLEGSPRNPAYLLDRLFKCCPHGDALEEYSEVFNRKWGSTCRFVSAPKKAFLTPLFSKLCSLSTSLLLGAIQGDGFYLYCPLWHRIFQGTTSTQLHLPLSLYLAEEVYCGSHPLRRWDPSGGTQEMGLLFHGTCPAEHNDWPIFLWSVHIHLSVCI